jgi:hypothetical protein
MVEKNLEISRELEDEIFFYIFELKSREKRIKIRGIKIGRVVVSVYKINFNLLLTVFLLSSAGDFIFNIV